MNDSTEFDNPELSVVMPCLNEADTVGICVEKAVRAMHLAGINGEVVVGFMVDSAGNVRNAYVIRSTRREFESEALRAVTRTRFKPGRKNGADVNTRNVSVPILFNITGN